MLEQCGCTGRRCAHRESGGGRKQQRKQFGVEGANCDEPGEVHFHHVEQTHKRCWHGVNVHRKGHQFHSRGANLKEMTALLRHNLDNRHWSADAEGFVFFRDLKKLLNSRGLERVAIQTDEIIYVVASGNRFEILWDNARPETAMRIRASQGHSERRAQLIDDEATFLRLTANGVSSGAQEVSGVCIHGTSFSEVASVLSVSEQGGIIPGGLSRMQFLVRDPRMKAGMRRDATEVEIHVRLSALLGDGQVCYPSSAVVLLFHQRIAVNHIECVCVCVLPI